MATSGEYNSICLVFIYTVNIVVSSEILFTQHDTTNFTTGKPEGINCTIYPLHSSLNETIPKLIDMVKLMVYNVSFPEYDAQLWNDVVRYYRPHVWYRASTLHGETLLTLPQNYEKFSLQMLSFGVHRMNISLADAPSNCYGTLPNETKVLLMRQLLLNDFKDVNYAQSDWTSVKICNVMVSEGPLRFARFQPTCCQRSHKTDLKCVVQSENEWIYVLVIFLEIWRAIMILYGPLWILKLVYPGDLNPTVHYTMFLDDPLTLSYPSSVKTNNQPCEMKQPAEDSQGESEEVPLKYYSAEKVQRQTFQKLELLVDHSSLINESSTPVSLFGIFKEEFVKCRLLEGKWAQNITKDDCCCGTHGHQLVPCKHCNCKFQNPTWGTIVHSVNVSLLIATFAPLPFIIRCVLFYFWEKDEAVEQDQASARVGLHGPYPWNFWLGAAWPGPAVAVYVIFAVSTMTLVIYRRFVHTFFDNVFQSAIRDMLNISYVRLIRTFVRFIGWPFKRYGCILGFGLSLLLTLFMPFLLLVLLFYGVPLFYMTGRFFWRKNIFQYPVKRLTTRWPFKHMIINENIERKDSSSRCQAGKTSLASVLDLKHISPNQEYYEVRSPYNQTTATHGRCRTLARSLVVSISAVMGMYTLVLMWAEGIHCLIYMAVMTSIGAIINADNILDYFLLLFWTVVYVYTALKTVQDKYSKMSEHVFSFLKAKLNERITEVTRIPKDHQKHVALQYFTKTQLREIKHIMEKYVSESSATIDQITGINNQVELEQHSNDVAKWRVRNLVLFIDKDDKLRIPKALFEELCSELRGPGFPGPLRQSLLLAIKQVIIMIAFLVLVYVIVMSFNGVIRLSSSNQLLITLAGGFLPLILRGMKPKAPAAAPHIHTVQGKVEEILLKYCDEWPCVLPKHKTKSSPKQFQQLFKQPVFQAISNSDDQTTLTFENVINFSQRKSMSLGNLTCISTHG